VSRGSVLLVDDDAVFRAALTRSLERDGYEVVSAADADDGIASLESLSFDVVLTDLRMPGVDGIEFIRRIRRLDPEAMCIVITGYGSAERSIEALQAGAFWFLDKNYEQVGTFGALLEKALEFRRLKSSNRQLQRQLEARYGFDNIIGEADSLRAMLDVVRKVADTDATVLILGESGAGKELVARATHYNSRRADQPFVAVNCGAIPEELLESELFGHVRGAFTGAVRDRIGRFAEANGGTLFLDEIGDMSPTLQTKLLRVLQEREFQPVGSSRTETVDVRIVTATNQDLEELIKQRRFREDLYFRLHVVPIEVPPLRERREDIPLLVEHFLRERTREHPDILGITEAAMKRLVEYEWPGNVRELQSLIERMVVLKQTGWIDETDVPPPMNQKRTIQPKVSLPADGLDFSAHIEDFATDLIRQALAVTGWNKNRAAKLLGLKRTTLVEKIRTMGIERPDKDESSS
jgi:DNA-binding NtrC family response regulator